MTGLLASVADLKEARLVLAAGADIVDLKDPQQGVLGAVSQDIAGEVVRHIAGRCPVSATVGDLPMQAEVIASAIEGMATAGVNLIKVGTFGVLDDKVMAMFAAQASAGHAIVVVFFADRAPDLSVVPDLAAAGIHGVMLDTADKHNGHLRAHSDDAALATFVAKARSYGFVVGLAGSLRLDDIPPLLALQPDYLGFRGALCRGNRRTHAIDPVAVREVRAWMAGSSRNGHDQWMESVL